MSFPILLGDKPRLLILGSMPGQISLAKKQYYANKQNAFWWIMSELVPFEMVLNYTERTQALMRARIAVWDVLSDCERPGSLDSNIVRQSEQANDFKTLFAKNRSIELIAFNGMAAKQIFMRHCKFVFDDLNIPWVQLPSTSPAHAAVSREDKLAVWRTALASFITNNQYAK